MLMTSFLYFGMMASTKTNPEAGTTKPEQSNYKKGAEHERST